MPESLPTLPDDWLILGGDVTNGAKQLGRCFRELTHKFRRVVWVPGNHELWTVPGSGPREGGVALYERLVRIARSHGVLTPEDPYPLVRLPDGPVLICPLFLLYDYSFRPRHVGRHDVVRWARDVNGHRKWHTFGHRKWHTPGRPLRRERSDQSGGRPGVATPHDSSPSRARSASTALDAVGWMALDSSM